MNKNVEYALCALEADLPQVQQLKIKQPSQKKAPFFGPDYNRKTAVTLAKLDLGDNSLSLLRLE